MKSRNRLFRCGDQILFFVTLLIGLVVFTDHLVKFVVELTQLSNFLHHFLAHEERRVENFEVFVAQNAQRQLNDRLFEKDRRTLRRLFSLMPRIRLWKGYLHKITTRSGHERTAFAIVTINHIHQIKMRIFLSSFHIAEGAFGDVIVLNTQLV